MDKDSVSASRQYVAALTGLRGIAAFGVYLYHFRHFNPELKLQGDVSLADMLLHYPLAFGFAGVDLFFVLSGFLLTLPFAAARMNGIPRPATGPYLKRRVLRVFPAYYAQLLIILLVGAWFLSWRSLDAGELLGHALMFFHIGPSPVEPLVGIWWTLPVELGFYLLLPMLAVAMTPRRWPVILLAGLLVTIAYRYWAGGAFGGHQTVLIASQIPGSLAEFLLGATAAMVYHRRSAKPASGIRLEAMFVLAPLAIWSWHWFVVLPNSENYWSGHWSMLLGTVVLGGGLSVMVFSAYRGSRLAAVLLANRPVYALGLVSYSLYLWHFVVLQQLPVVLGAGYESLSVLPRFMVATAATLAVASLSYFLFERPFFRLGPRNAARAPATE